jgi:hypothetical protein
VVITKSSAELKLNRVPEMVVEDDPDEMARKDLGCEKKT